MTITKVLRKTTQPRAEAHESMAARVLRQADDGYQWVRSPHYLSKAYERSRCLPPQDCHEAVSPTLWVIGTRTLLQRKCQVRLPPPSSKKIKKSKQAKPAPSQPSTRQPRRQLHVSEGGGFRKRRKIASRPCFLCSEGCLRCYLEDGIWIISMVFRLVTSPPWNTTPVIKGFCTRVSSS